MRTFLRCGLIIGFSLGVGSAWAAATNAPAKPAVGDKTEIPKAAGKPAAAEKPAGETAPGPATANFTKLFVEWRELLAKMRQVQERFQVATPSGRPALVKEFEALLDEGRAAAPKLEEAAEKAFAEDPKNEQIGNFLLTVEADHGRSDDYEEAYRLGKLLIDGGYNNAAVFNIAGIAAFCENDFASAREYFKKAADGKGLSDLAKKYQELLDTNEDLWKKETEVRDAEAKADDLPRVKISTSKGDIVVELFENQAPNATANFISLVEKGFYDNTVFHRVLPSFMAQGGDPEGSGRGGPGYSIACECYRPDYRRHFRGTLSMAHAGRDTGGSQFFLTFVPTNNLNGKHTAFGRVIEGMDVLSKLQRIDPENPKGEQPDRIVKATVLRKRSHQYVPVKK